MPPTNGIEPLCNFLVLGLSTKPTLSATLRNKKREAKEKKNKKARSIKEISTIKSQKLKFDDDFNVFSLYDKGHL